MEAPLIPTECAACHSTLTDAQSEDKRLQICLHCMRVAGVEDKPSPIVVESAEEEERLRLGHPGKACASCDD